MSKNFKEYIKSIKDELYNMQIENKTEDIHHILKIRGIPAETQQTLLLLFSNIKADMQLIKSFQLRSLGKMTDVSLEIVGELEDSRERHKKDVELLQKEIDNNKLSKLAKTLIGAGGVILFLMTLYTIAPDAAKWAVSETKEIFLGRTPSQTTVESVN